MSSEPLTTTARVRRMFDAHQPEINYQYEYCSCTCGWADPDALGRKTIRDGSRDWRQHFRKQIAALPEETL